MQNASLFSFMQTLCIQFSILALLPTLFYSQERGISEAAGKLADCQNTIASISRQLKLLTDFDLVLDAEEPQLADREIFSNSPLPNGQDRGLQQSSVPSQLLDNGKCLLPIRSCIHIQI